MELQKNELIGKLKEILALYEHAVAIRSEMDTLEPEDNYERTVVVPQFPGEYDSERQRQIWRDKLDHTYEDALGIAERTHREVYGPKEPEKPKLTAFKKPEDRELKEKIEKCKIRSYIGAGVGGFFLIGIISCLADDSYSALPVVIALALIGVAAFVFFLLKGNKAKAAEEKLVAEALAAHNRQQEELKAEYAKKMKAYESECAQYEGQLETFLEDYRDWREIYLQSIEEEAQIEKKLEADREAAVERMRQEQYVPALEKLEDSNDLVSVEYLSALSVLIDLLVSGRADDLKEAINLYEDLVYRERQLQLQREKEEHRQQEEEQRRQDEERRYREDMQFRKDQERQRQREEERRQQDAERRHREDMALREKQERDRQYEERRRMDEERRRADRAESDRRQKEERDTRDQCNRCAQGHCSMAFRRPNCASFKPR